MTPAAPPLDTHRLGDLVVTMATVDQMRAEAARLNTEAEAISTDADRLRADAVGMFVEAGFMLVGRAKEWAPSAPNAETQLAHANEVIKAMEAEGFAVVPDDEQKSRGLGGLFRRRKEAPEPPEVRRRREEKNAQLRVILSELGRSFGGAHPAVAPAHSRAVGLEAQSKGDQERAGRMRADAAALETEAAGRAQTTTEFGFDILLTAAQLDAHGPSATRSQLDLRPGERLYFTQASELARQKSMATPERAEDGLPVPKEKTGIVYVVGRYVGQLIKQEDLVKLGAGTLVITNKRIAFVGNMKSFQFPLKSVLWATQYRDGLVLLREGRENADVMVTPAAGQVLFHLNWVMLEASGLKDS